MNLAHAILSALDNVAPRLLPEASILVDAGHFTGENLTFSILRRELVKLEERELIASVQNELSGVKYRITDAGKGALLA